MPRQRDSRGRFISNQGNGQMWPDPMIFNMGMNYGAQLTENVLRRMYPQQRGGTPFDPRRDIDDECGFPKRGGITLDMYQYLYEREPIAARVVEIMPRESWKVSPSIFETEDAKTVTDFEAEWDKLFDTLQGENWFQCSDEEQGSPVWSELQLVDELSGIGNFGGLLFGLKGDGDLEEPAKGIGPDTGIRTKGARNELVYLRSYDQDKMKIVEWENDKSSPRYGKPKMYSVKLGGFDLDADSGVMVPNLQEERVHWTRILHVADVFHQACSSDVLAIPRMRPVYNNLWSIRKEAGASGEFYWRHGSRDMIISSHPQLGGKVRWPANMLDDVEQFSTGLQRVLRLAGADAKTLNPAVSDPTPHIMIQVKLICIKLGCPERIFWGSERGQLSSNQDERAWAERMMNRQSKYNTPRIIVPFINRLIMLGVLPEPKDGYFVVWPNLRELSPTEKAAIAVQRMEAMTKYASGGAHQLMAPIDFLTRELDYTQEEAKQILKEAQKENEGEEPMIAKQQPPQQQPGQPPQPGKEEGQEVEEEGGQPEEP